MGTNSSCVKWGAMKPIPHTQGTSSVPHPHAVSISDPQALSQEAVVEILPQVARSLAKKSRSAMCTLSPGQGLLSDEWSGGWVALTPS